MRTKLKQITSVCLAVIMILGVLTIAPISASAANNTQKTAKSISTNTTYTDRLSTQGEEDYYKFTLSSSSKVSINFKHSLIDSSNIYWYVNLYNMNGDELVSISSAGNKTDLTSSNVGLPSGSYYIKVYHQWSYYKNNDYSFKISCSSETNWETEINDEYSNGDTVLLNKTYNGSLAKQGDVDYYKFTLSSSSKVSINFKHSLIDSSNIYWYVNLYNMNGDELVSISSAGNKTDLTSSNVGLPSGSYYIKVYHQWSYYKNNDYSFKISCSSETNWETEINDDYSNGDTVSLNKTYNGSLAKQGDVDYYKFTLSSSSKVSINFKHSLIDSSNIYWYVKLYNMNGDELLSLSSAGNKTNLTSSNVAINSGNYYIKVYHQWSYYKNNDYSFSINTNSTTTTNPTSVSVSPSSLTLNVGGTYTLTKSVYPSNASTSYTWSSSNTNVATVSNGKVTAKKAGTANITVKTSNGKTATCKVTVIPTTTNPTYVKLSKTSLTLGAGETYTLTKTVSPSNASTSYTWSSSNTSVATVSNGKITAKKAGTANITVKTSNGKTATCKLTVKPAPTSVRINPSSLTLGYGESYNISGVTNSNSWSTNFTWTSSNTKVATVTGTTANNAKITTKGIGTTTITIRTYNGKTATCKVTVKPAPTSVTVNPLSITLGVGEKLTISESTNSGSYANASNLVWSSYNTSVATVAKGSGNKATVTAKKTGTTYVSIKTFNGKTATCKVTVKPAPTSVKLSATNITLNKGQTYTISESTNSGSYANASNLVWSSNNSSVATVTKGSSNKATVKAVNKGTAYITIKTYNGKTATCKVTVK